MIIQKILIFAIFLGPLIFFHELGHFLFARLFGVRVETFSIGFGPKIFRKKIGDTVYALSLIPLGGYVKMFGDDPLSADELSEDDKKAAYTHKSKWARFWIVFGGPLANFIFAFFIYLGLTNVGEKVPEAKFGKITSESIFGKAGLRTGDGLRAINEMQVISFDDLNIIDTDIKNITIMRASEKKTFNIEINSMDFIKEFTSISTQFRAPIVQDGKGGLFLISLTKKASYDRSLEEIFNSEQSIKYVFKISSEISEIKTLEELVLSNNAKKINNVESIKQLAKEGYFPMDLSVQSVQMNSAADKAGIKSLDVITKINGHEILNFNQLRELVQANDNLDITILRNGKTLNKTLIPEKKMQNGKEVKLIGVASGIVFMPHKMLEVVSSSFYQSVISSLRRTKEVSYKTLLGFKKLITGEVALKNIGGPFAIGKVASDSFNISLSMFFRLMAMISINLGIINLFPIPVLDGGHIVFIFLELVNGGPLSRKKLMIAQQFGMSLLFVLIFFAIFNDISRFFL